MKFKSSMDPLLQVLTSLSLSIYIYIYKYVYFAHIQHVSLTGFCPDSVYGNYTSKLDPVNFGTQ